MRTTSALLVVGGVFALYWLNKAVAAGRLSFFPGDVTGFGIEGITPVANITLRVQNSSNASLKINSLSGNVYANNTLVGNLSGFQPVYIRGNSEGTIPVNVRFQPIGIVNQLIQAWNTHNFQEKFTVDGTVNAEGIPVPLKMEYSLG